MNRWDGDEVDCEKDKHCSCYYDGYACCYCDFSNENNDDLDEDEDDDDV